MDSERPLRRRDVLRFAGGGLLGSLAGCTALADPIVARTHRKDAPATAPGGVWEPWSTLGHDAGRTGDADERGPGADAELSRVGDAGRRPGTEPIVAGKWLLFAETTLEASDDPSEDRPGTESRLVAVNRNTRERAWTFPVPRPCSPPLFSGYAAFCVTPGETVAIDARDGSICWRYDVGRGGTLATPATVGEYLFVPDSHRVHSLHAETGTHRWRSEKLFEGGTTGVTVTDELVLTAGGTAADATKALDRATGDVVWRAPPSGGSIVVADDDERAYVVDRGGTLHALSLDDGTPDWRASGVDHTVRPALANGTLYIGSAVGSGDEYLIALDAATGDEEWRRRIGPYGTFTPPVVGADRVYVQTSTGVTRAIVAFDAGTGKRRWRKRLPLVLGGPVALGEGKLYLLGDPEDEGGTDREAGVYVLD